MHIREVQDILAPYGLGAPDLEMLQPTAASYRCMLLQPGGGIYAGVERIGPLDRAACGEKAVRFLSLAQGVGAHLVITPEYFLPWTSLHDILLSGNVPPKGALWVLGCESATQADLEAFKAAVNDDCEVIYEPIEALQTDRLLLDPVVLLFQSLKTDGENRLVALVQFKTTASRDDLFLEESLLKCGTTIYHFNGINNVLGAAVVICSDVFSMSDEVVGKLVDRSTLIHIQLNPGPRNSAYRQYRKTTFDIDPNGSLCHIACLNWAGSVVQHDGDGNTANWPAIAGSTWYCPELGCSHDDALVLPNHSKGLYYAYMSERRHALLFHYDEAVFDLRVPKVMTTGKAVLANRNGPSAIERYVWDAGSSNWIVDAMPADSGFSTLINLDGNAHHALEHVLDNASVLDIERLLALSAGTVMSDDSWCAARNIDSCRINEDEIVHRITVAQDNDPVAVDFRHARLQVAANIRHELDTCTLWPPQINGVDPESRIEWNPGGRHFNIRCSDGRPALISYLGESPGSRVLEIVCDKLVHLLRRAGGPHYRRLCVMYREFGQLKFAPLPALTRFDDALDDLTDILTVNPE